MPKEKPSLLGMLRGDEPGPVARVLHSLSGGSEGDWGEKCAESVLKNRSGGGRVFRNVYVPFSDGTAEVDVLLVHETGLYVVESKAYGGRISGGPGDMKWNQRLGGRNYPFYNPVRQNETHCRRLARALEVPRERMVSLVVFENRADLSGVAEKSGADFTVCSRRELPRCLEAAISARRPVFSPRELAALWGPLEAWSQADPEARERHIRQLEQRMFGGTCPVCGRPLAERRGSRGPFLGCTGYPQCTYTRAVDARNPSGR